MAITTGLLHALGTDRSYLLSKRCLFWNTIALIRLPFSTASHYSKPLFHYRNSGCSEAQQGKRRSHVSAGTPFVILRNEPLSSALA